MKPDNIHLNYCQIPDRFAEVEVGYFGDVCAIDHKNNIWSLSPGNLLSIVCDFGAILSSSIISWETDLASPKFYLDTFLRKTNTTSELTIAANNNAFGFGHGEWSISYGSRASSKFRGTNFLVLRCFCVYLSYQSQKCFSIFYEWILHRPSLDQTNALLYTTNTNKVGRIQG